MKRARDVREQLVGLMERVEIEIVSADGETVNIRKVLYLASYNLFWLSKEYKSDAYLCSMFSRPSQQATFTILHVFPKVVNTRQSNTIRLL